MAVLCASLSGLCLLTLASGAGAAEARRRFVITSKPYAEALIDLAVQANVSILNVAACGSEGRAQLSGRYSISDALARILAGAPCRYHIVDAQTVRITALPSPGHAVIPATPVVTELLVTARKRPERLDTLPAGVSAVSSEQLFETNAYDVRATAGQLVGVLTTNLGPGRDKLLIRGLSDGAFTGRARSTVSTYLDEAPTNYNAPDPDLRLTDVARVETLRGPQGALYGSGALSGVYRIVTNKPDLERASGGIQATYASTNGGAGSYVGEGYLNVPLAEGRSALRLVAYYDDQGGYLDDVSLRLSNVDSTVRTGGRAMLRVEIAPRWTLDVGLVAQRLTSRDTQYTTLSNLTQRANQVREASANDFAQAQASLHGELGWADLSASTSYVQHAYSSDYDASAAAVAFNDHSPTIGIYSESARVRRLIQDIVLTSSDAGSVSWLAGVYGAFSTERTPASLDILASGPVTPVSGTTQRILFTPLLTDTDGTLDAPTPLVRVYNENRHDRRHELAAYGEVTWRFAPSWTASAGLRAFDNDLRVRSNIVGAPPAQSRDVDLTDRFQGVSTKLSVQRQFDDTGLVYALFSDGYRPGGVNTTNFLTVHSNRTIFDPDRLQNFELGAKGEFLDRRLTLRGAIFYDRWTNLQSDQYRQSGLAYTANVGDVNIKGAEAEAAYEWSSGLTLQANALYSAPKFTRTNPDFIAPGASGLSGLPGAPRWSGGAFARYERPLPYHDLTLRLVAQASYTGRARLTFDPTLSARTDAVIESRLVADLVAHGWSAGLFISNPTNASGDTFAYGNPFTFGQVRQVTPQRPRTFGVRLAKGF